MVWFDFLVCCDDLSQFSSSLVFVWVVVRAGSPNMSFFVAMPAWKNPQEFWEKCSGDNIQQVVPAHCVDAQGRFQFVIVAFGGTGMEVNHQ
jgi:hypothetical protein